LHGDLRRGIELKDAKGLLGPVVVVSYEIRDEAAGFAQPLGVRETVVSLPELHLGPLSVFDVDNQAVPMSDATFRVMERLSNGLNPTILTVRAPELVDILVG
jgi:hypothetical protein